jgi:hypothetical protein
MRAMAFWWMVMLLAALAVPAANAQKDGPEYGIYDGNPGFMYHGNDKTEAVVELAQWNGQLAFRLSVWSPPHGFSATSYPGVLFIGASGVACQFDEDQRESFQLAKSDIVEAKVTHSVSGPIGFEFHTKSKEYKVWAVRTAVANASDIFYRAPSNSPLEMQIKRMLGDFPSALLDLQKVQHAGEEEIAALNPDQAKAKIQELQSEIAAAEGRAQSDDQQYAALKAKMDEYAAQGGVAGAIGQGASGEAALGYQQKAESERSKIALMNAEIQQLQVKIGAAQQVQNQAPAAPAPGPPSVEPAAQAVPPPPNPNAPPSATDSGPSLAETMQFIQDKLNGIGPITFVANIHDNAGDRAAHYSVELMRVSANPATCMVTYHVKEMLDGRALEDRDLSTALKQIQNIQVMGEAQYLARAGAAAGHPEAAISQVDPPTTVLETARTSGRNRFFFADDNMANRVAKAMTHAAELCQAGQKPEPF